MKKILFILILIVSSFASTNDDKKYCNCGCYPNYQVPTCNQRVVCRQAYRTCCRLDYFAPIDPYIDYY